MSDPKEQSGDSQAEEFAREALRMLLAQEFAGVKELREQAVGCEVAVISDYDDNYGSCELRPTVGERAHVTSRIPVEATFRDEDGAAVFVLLHVVDGWLDELEIYKEDGSALQRKPSIRDLQIEVSPR